MNEHNPIAVAVSRLQEQWNQSVHGRDYKMVRWLVAKQDADIFKGFLKLESTVHGSLEETFIIMLTPFESPDTYGQQLITDWLEIFGRDQEQNNLPEWADYAAFKSRWADWPAGTGETRC